jgi:hypothetical protein
MAAHSLAIVVLLDAWRRGASVNRLRKAFVEGRGSRREGRLGGRRVRRVILRELEPKGLSRAAEEKQQPREQQRCPDSLAHPYPPLTASLAKRSARQNV